jgi:hypothetical protein
MIAARCGPVFLLISYTKLEGPTFSAAAQSSFEERTISPTLFEITSGNPVSNELLRGSDRCEESKKSEKARKRQDCSSSGTVHFAD